MAAVTEDMPQDPAYITYLLTPKLCDCFFIVGNQEQMEPERIGVVGKMLLAHSEVLRCDMFAQEVEDKKDVTVDDTHPDTFKNLLRYVYGFDNTGQLDFDEADNLLYVAEKWQVLTLKSRLSTRLIKLLTPDNICSLLNNPAVYKALELDSAITSILQYETDHVLASSSFLDLSVDGLVKIVEQEALGVAEIDVWKAAVRWAKHRAGSDSGAALRQELERPAKHIRVCTVDDSSFFKEVARSKILTSDEISMVCCYKGGEGKQQNLTTFSNEVVCRKCTSQASALTFDHLNEAASRQQCLLHIHTKCHAIELLPLKCKASNPCTDLERGVTFDMKCVIRYVNSTEYFKTSEVCEQVDCWKEFMVPLTRGGKNIVLEPNTKYWMVMAFCGDIQFYYNEENKTYDNEHMSVTVYSKVYDGDDCYYPFNTLSYRPLPQE